MRKIPSERPSMLEGCEFEIRYTKKLKSKISLQRSQSISTQVWYKAIIETKPPTNPGFKRRELHFRLLKDDTSTPLTQLTHHFRPIPPENVKALVGIKVGSIVEAEIKGGWWTCLVVKEIEDDNFLVRFDSVPDIIQLQRKHLRPYLEWLDEGLYTWWKITSNCNTKFFMRLREDPMFSPGTMVEVSTRMRNAKVVWVPAMIIEEIREDGDDDEYKYNVKPEGNEARPNKSIDLLNLIDLASLRPTPPPFWVEEYQLMEYVEVFRGTGWRQGRVMGTRSQNQYLVLLEATKTQLVFRHSDLRPLKVWEDGVWKRRESTQGSEKKICDSEMNEKESDPPVTPSSNITATPLNQIEAETQRKTLPRNQNGSGNVSTQENVKENSEDNNRKRRREENLRSVASVVEDKAKDTTMVLPFEKKLPIWKTLESFEVFKTVPQSPHFSPLVETGEDSREISAVGLMLTFSGLLEEVKALQHDKCITSLLSLRKSFAELEKHGFNVKAPQLRISKLLALRNSQPKKIEELRGFKKVIAEKESIKVENERKILELQRLNEEADKEIAGSKSCAAKIVQQLEHVKLQFQTTASAPW